MCEWERTPPCLILALWGLNNISNSIIIQHVRTQHAVTPSIFIHYFLGAGDPEHQQTPCFLQSMKIECHPQLRFMDKVDWTC